MLRRAALVFLLSIVECSTASAESAYRRLTPGTSTRADAVRALGAPLRETDTLGQHRPSGSQDSIYVHYGEGSATVEKIEVVFAEPSDRAEVVKTFALTDPPLLGRANAQQEFEEYFDAGRFIVLTYLGPDAASAVERAGFLTRAAFENRTKRRPGIARPTPATSGGATYATATPSGASISPPQLATPLPAASASPSPAGAQALTISDLRVADNGVSYDVIFHYSGPPDAVKAAGPAAVQMSIHCSENPFIVTVSADTVIRESTTAGEVSATLLKDMGSGSCEVEVRLKHDGVTLSNPLSRSVTFVSEESE